MFYTNLEVGRANCNCSLATVYSQTVFHCPFSYVYPVPLESHSALLYILTYLSSRLIFSYQCSTLSLSLSLSVCLSVCLSVSLCVSVSLLFTPLSFSEVKGSSLKVTRVVKQDELGPSDQMLIEQMRKLELSPQEGYLILRQTYCYIHHTI